MVSKYSKGAFVFLKKLFLITYVCAKKTKGRHRGLQCVSFSEDILLKNVCVSSSSRRHGLGTSNLFKPLLKTHLHIFLSFIFILKT
ncbi:hypothetical protein Hanom_Chr16g01476371 [Helianthus anomalus]